MLVDNKNGVVTSSTELTLPVGLILRGTTATGVFFIFQFETKLFIMLKRANTI